MKKEKNKRLVLLVELFSEYYKYQYKLKEALGGDLINDPDGDWLFSKADNVITEIIGCDFRTEVYYKIDPKKSYDVGVFLSLPEFDNQKVHIGDGMMNILFNIELSAEEKIKRILGAYNKAEQYLNSND